MESTLGFGFCVRDKVGDGAGFGFAFRIKVRVRIRIRRGTSSMSLLRVSSQKISKGGEK